MSESLRQCNVCGVRDDVLVCVMVIWMCPVLPGGGRQARAA
jgi:hypothetical protein